jgi:hypothetical protein
MPRGKKTLRSVVSSPLAPSIPAPPVTVAPAAPAAHNQAPSLMNIVKEGVAFGVGSEMGHRLVRMFTGATATHATPATAATPATSVVDKTDYSKCIERGSEPTLCKELYGDQDFA